MIKWNSSGLIASFMDQYEFLSNFYMSNVYYEGIMFPSAEHAYQAAKSNVPSTRQWIADLPTPGDAKKVGRKIDIDLGLWNMRKPKVMQDIIRIKFSSKSLSSLLLDTYPYTLVEGNWWGDTYWGANNETLIGWNMLGQILMIERTNQLQKILTSNF